MAKIMAAVISIIILVGVGLPVLAQLVSNTTDLDTASENITALNNTAVSLSNTDIVASTFEAGNSTNNLTASDYQLDAEDGLFTLTNNSYNDTELATSYSYKPTGYADSPLVRLILPLTLVGLAIAALLIGFNIQN